MAPQMSGMSIPTCLVNGVSKRFTPVSCARYRGSRSDYRVLITILETVSCADVNHLVQQVVSHNITNRQGRVRDSAGLMNASNEPRDQLSAAMLPQYQRSRRQT